MKKLLQILVLIVFTLLIIIDLIFIQLSLTINNTIFSDRYFNKKYDYNITDKKIEGLVNNFITNAEDYLPKDNSKPLATDTTEMIATYKQTLKDNIDIIWFQKEIPNVFKGSFAYFSGHNDKLPIINIKPLKESFVNIYAAQMLLASDDNMTVELDNLVIRLKKVPGGLLVNGQANGKAVDMFLASELGENLALDRLSAEEVIEKMAVSTNSKETTTFVIKKMLASKMGINTMKDKLDLNILFKNIYKDNNPVDDGKDLVNNIRTKFLITTILIIICLISTVYLVLFKSKKFLRWVGVSFILGGLISFISLFIYRNNLSSLTDSITKALTNKIDFSFIQEWILNYINGISTYILIQGIIIVIMGILAIVYSFRRKNILKDDIHKKNYMLIRLLAIFIIIGTIALSVIVFVNDVVKDVKEYQLSSANNKKIDVNKALGKTLNTTLFESMNEQQ